jgi:hypothetical protein
MDPVPSVERPKDRAHFFASISSKTGVFPLWLRAKLNRESNCVLEQFGLPWVLTVQGQYSPV